MSHLQCTFSVLSGQPDAPLLSQRTVAPSREQLKHVRQRIWNPGICPFALDKSVIQVVRRGRNASMHVEGSLRTLTILLTALRHDHVLNKLCRARYIDPSRGKWVRPRGG